MLGWIVRNRAWTPWYLVRYWRLLVFRLRHPAVLCEGMVFLDRGVSVEVRRGYGRLTIGPWVHLGHGVAVRCHEGTLRIGAKCVLGRYTTINTYLDVAIGDSTIVADWVYISDFDHKTADVTVPIKDQGIVKSPVRIGSDVWLGTKVTVTRGVDIGDGCVVAANAVVTRDLPAYSVSAGIPALVIRDRRDTRAKAEDERLLLARIAERTAAAARAAVIPVRDPRS
ncbi:MAG: acyltransferase [Jatrophihabitans sp.]